MKRITKIVAYYRVSTKRQGESGLGLEGQQAAVAAFAKQHGASIVANYIEIESGKRSNRPVLAQALGHARLAKATLAVAKLDRLARNVAFLSALMESGVDFVACDNEHANRLTIHILAAVAEAEAKAISERTKTALAAAKRRGVKLGSARPGHWKGRESKRDRNPWIGMPGFSPSGGHAFSVPAQACWRRQTPRGAAGSAAFRCNQDHGARSDRQRGRFPRMHRLPACGRHGHRS
jgi:DNA invertase Pin-like site-specific DNA recombinase